MTWAQAAGPAPEMRPAPLPSPVLFQCRDLLGRMVAQWPPDVREPLIARHLDPEGFRTGMRERSNLAEQAAEVRDAGPVPDVPLITFTGLGIDPGQRMYLSEQLLREQSEAKRVMFGALAGSVTDGEHRVLDHASHTWLHIEAADAVVQGIRDMLGKVRP